MEPGEDTSKDYKGDEGKKGTPPEEDDKVSTTDDMDWLSVMRCISDVWYPPTWPCKDFIDAVLAVEEWQDTLHFLDKLDRTKAGNRLEKHAFSRLALWTNVGVTSTSTLHHHAR